MSYYSGKFIIHNNTDQYYENSYFEQTHIMTMKFSASFNDMKLYLNNTLVKQLLSSKTLQKYIVNECESYMLLYSDAINNTIQSVMSIENTPAIKIRVLGKYLYINMYCGRNHTIDDCVRALARKLRNEKTREEILRGDD